MRIPIILLAFAGLSACNSSTKPAGQAVGTPVTFDGAGATAAAAKVGHGERLTHVLGCTGCHGKTLEGKYFYERYASNLTRDVARYDDASFRRLLHEGIPYDGRELWGMPSEIFQFLSDADTSALIAYLRTLQPTGEPTRKPLPWEPDAVEMIRKGEFMSAAKTVIHDRSLAPADLGPDYALGRYITMVTCSECHGPTLGGAQPPKPGEPPDLIVAGGYSRAEFQQLMTHGEATGHRKISEMMSGVAQRRFSHMTPHERDALYDYLKARAEQPQ